MELTSWVDSYLIGAVKLRDHPLLTRKSGYIAWPPKWTTTRLDKSDKPTGEIGTLEQVLRNDLFDNKIFMFIQHQGFRYMGSIHVDEPKFCSELLTLLRSNVGRSIQEIGELDLSHML